MTNQMLEWREVEGYHYEVSNDGQVRNTITGQVVKPWLVRKTGYLQVMLWKNNKRWHTSIHRLALRAFHGEPPTAKHICAHGDGVKTNNRADNLRWATVSENAFDCALHGTLRRGEQINTAKLNAQAVMSIRASTESCAAIAKRIGMEKSTIADIRARRSWRHVA